MKHSFLNFFALAALCLVFAGCEPEPIEPQEPDKPWNETGFDFDAFTAIWPYDDGESVTFVSENGDELTLSAVDYSLFYQPLYTSTPEEGYSADHEWAIIQGALIDGVTSYQSTIVIHFWFMVADRQVMNCLTDFTNYSNMGGTSAQAAWEAEDPDDHTSVFNQLKEVVCYDKKGNALETYRADEGLISFTDADGVHWTKK